MTNKLVVIINSLKVPKIKKLLLYEMKFLVANYSCLQNPWLGGYRPQIPILSVLNWICWTPPKKIPGYATVLYIHLQILKYMNCIVNCNIVPYIYFSLDHYLACQPNCHLLNLELKQITLTNSHTNLHLTLTVLQLTFSLHSVSVSYFCYVHNRH